MGRRKGRPAIERFWDYVTKGEPDDCWLWEGGRRGQYGSFVMEGSKGAAHKAAYLLFNGPIPDGMDILHSCDTPLCVNPKHLRPGTHTENMREMIAKGRGKTQTKDMLGEQSVHHKLTEEQAYEVLRLISQGYSHSKIGAMYGVSDVCIHKIRVGKSWPHLKRD